MTAKKKTFWIIGGVSAMLVLLVILRVVSNARASRQHEEVDNLTVSISKALVQPMPLTLTAVGQVLPLHTVQVRPQVSGMLKEVYFTEGQFVSQGQRLFLIDPAPYQAALASAKAAAENAKANAERLAPLAKQDYATQQELDDAQATADQDQATYQQAEINLSYTDIRAPIAGRTGSLAVKSGNILALTDTNPLVVINQMQPIQVQFNLAQQFLPQVRDYEAKHALKVLITREDGTGKLDQGDLVFIDNSVNTSTGTVMFKASLPNQHEQLWPGQYVGVTMQLALQANAIVVPQSAVLTGQDGNYVYVVEDGKAEQQNIKVDRQIGDFAVVSAGLKGGEEVVTRVPRNLRPGMNVIPGQDAAAPAPIVSLPGSQ
ncbi:MAG TPA: efflux RND transporter periplasmic adaptor subunit [Gammaproteobacteria bacterium]|nr:efflux RND transporter periplasmic adaptor subunit [Gammaproteobacteria bacterium]